MKIVTSSGKTLEADWTLHTTSRRGVKQLIVQLTGEINVCEIVDTLVGADMIQEFKADGVCTAYEGYTLLSSIIYTHDRSAVRVTLEKGDAA